MHSLIGLPHLTQGTGKPCAQEHPSDTRKCEMPAVQMRSYRQHLQADAGRPRLVAPRSSFFQGKNLHFLLENLHLYIKTHLGPLSSDCSRPSCSCAFCPCSRRLSPCSACFPWQFSRSSPCLSRSFPCRRCSSCPFPDALPSVSKPPARPPAAHLTDGKLIILSTKLIILGTKLIILSKTLIIFEREIHQLSIGVSNRTR